jgi:flagellar assembly protein FliH
MGLIKGSKIRVTETEAFVRHDGTVVMPQEASEVTGVVPRAAAPAQPTFEDEGAEEGWPEVPGDDELFGVVPQEDPQDDVSAPIAEYEDVRAHLIASANEAAELDAAPYGEAIQTAAGEFMEQRFHEASTALAEANPEGDFESVQPFVQRQAAAELELELIGTISEIRWSHLKRIEEKIVSEAGEVAEDIETRHPPETFSELIAQREEILSEARLEAERILLAANTQASAMMAQAEQMQAQTFLELESEKERILSELREQARQEGYDEGKAAGEQQAAQYVQEALLKLNEIMIAFPAAVKKHEEKLVGLAIEIASKVIQEEISLQPEIVQRTVETALRRVSDLEQVTVKVNPLDLDLILPKLDTFKTLVPDVQNFSIEGSHTLQRGGCIIETNSGSINAAIGTQLSIIEEVFRNVMAEYEDDMGEVG